MAEVRRAFVEIVGLRPTAADPPDVLERGERGGGRGRVGRLAVVDESDTVLLADALHAMRQAGIGAEAVGNLFLCQPKDVSHENGRADVLSIVRPLEVGPVFLPADMLAVQLSFTFED